MNLASPPLTSAVKTQRIALGIALGMMLLIVIYLLVSIFNADGTAYVIIDLLLLAVVIALQVFYIRRILSDWMEMSSARRCWTVIAAIIIPPVVAFAGIVLAGVALFLWIGSIFLGVSGSAGSSGSSGWTGPSGPAGWKPDFGSYWGNDRVTYGSDGRATWVGEDEVKYDSSGTPTWVGQRKVTDGSDGRPSWIGGDRVIFGSNHESPAWIGDRKVT